MLPHCDFNRLRQLVDAMALIRLTHSERAYLGELGYFDDHYLSWLSRYRFDPSEVTLTRDAGGVLHCEIEGPWERTILWETPLLALISEVAHESNDDGADLADFRRRSNEKGERLAQLGAQFVDFGTRRRRSFEAQRTALTGMVQTAGNAGFKGTSNLYFAQLLNLPVSGTIAHEWIMAHAGLYNVVEADSRALENWMAVYGPEKTVALTDTYTLNHFLRNLNADTAEVIKGFRHDSGDPFDFTDKVVSHLRRQGIDPREKVLVFSDGITVARAEEILNYVGGRAGVSFGIGTNLTNDFREPPFDIVIKMTSFDGSPAVKLTDEPGKAVGSPEAVEQVRDEIFAAPLPSAQAMYLARQSA